GTSLVLVTMIRRSFFWASCWRRCWARASALWKDMGMRSCVYTIRVGVPLSTLQFAGRPLVEELPQLGEVDDLFGMPDLFHPALLGHRQVGLSPDVVPFEGGGQVGTYFCFQLINEVFVLPCCDFPSKLYLGLDFFRSPHNRVRGPKTAAGVSFRALSDRLGESPLMQG